MNYNILGYGLYFLILLFVILYVGGALFRNGRHFLINIFSGDIQLADSINRILLSGYYLVNIGYSVIVIKIWEEICDIPRLAEVLALKLGAIVLALGIMHFLNVIVLIGIGRNKKQNHININH